MAIAAENGTDPCGICQEDSSCDFVTRCGHWFHEKCLKKWLVSRRSCPYCNQETSSSRMMELFRWNLKSSKFDKKKVAEAIEFYESSKIGLIAPVNFFYPGLKNNFAS